MAFQPNMSSILTAHTNGNPVTLINEAILSGRTFTPGIKYIETMDAFGNSVVLANAAMIGFTYFPEPLIGATTVDINVIDDTSTGWTGGN